MISIPCSRCGRTWPEDPKHPGYPDVHHCDERPMEPGVYAATILSCAISDFHMRIVAEIDGGPHDGKIITLQQRTP